MAKNTFLIRANVLLSNAGDTFNQTEIDLGSYTSLGSSKPEVLRIHTAHWYFQDDDTAGPGPAIPSMGGNKGGEVCWQLTTQSQSQMVLASDDSFLMGGTAGVRNADSADNAPSDAWENMLMPQDYTQGILVAVPSIFLGGFIGSEFVEDAYVSVILECSTEAMSKGAAVSLAVSQQ
jgi:hypothetical protein